MVSEAFRVGAASAAGVAIARIRAYAIRSTLAGTCLCHGVPARKSRSAEPVSKFGAIFDEIREINRLLDAGDHDALAAHQRNLGDMAGVLGVLRSPARAYLDEENGRHLTTSGIDPAGIERLIAERAAARKARDFRRADEIRNQLLARGIALKDGAEGTSWSTVS